MRYVTILFVLLALAASAVADEGQTPSHAKAAEELLVLMDAENQASAGATAMADVMLQGNPMLTPFRDVIVGWAARVMTWENMKPKMVAIYTETYTEGELRELISFYSTPLGKKIIKVSPELTRKGAMIGNDLAQEHMAELQAAIQARADELQQLQMESP